MAATKICAVHNPHEHHSPSYTDKLMVKKMVFAGIPHVSIARTLEISVDTLRKYYSKELNDSLEEAITSVACRLFQDAMDGNVNAAQYVLKTRGGKFGWQEKQTIEVQSSAEIAELEEKVRQLESEHTKEY